MNKQELIERIKKAKSFKLDESIINGPIIDFVELNTVIKLVNQANDTQKVKIPRFLANWIESYKHAHFSLSYAMSNISPEIRQWMDGDCVTKAEVFARAWLDGYEVEKSKEALYTVTLKSSGQKLSYHEKDEEYLFSSYNQCFLKDKHTRKELENAGFGWVFNCESMDVQE